MKNEQKMIEQFLLDLMPIVFCRKHLCKTTETAVNYKKDLVKQYEKRLLDLKSQKLKTKEKKK